MEDDICMDIRQITHQKLLSRAIRTTMVAGFGLMLTACNSGDDSTGGDTTPPPPPPEPNQEIQLDEWAFQGSNASMVTAAQVAGQYAVADARAGYIEIRDINEELMDTVDTQDFGTLGLSSSGEVCGMTFSPSGRFLFMAVCGAGSGNNKDAIVAYNTNTRRLSVFDRVTLSETGEHRPGMTYFQGQLYAGSDNGVYRYDAGMNVVYTGESSFNRQLHKTPEAVTGLAVDMVNQKIYLSTGKQLLSMNPNGSEMTKIATGTNLSALTMGRVYGNENGGGLFILENNGPGARLLTVPMNELRKGKTVSLSAYHQFDHELQDIAATADGRMLLTDEYNAKVMSDKSDTRLSYHEWLEDELDSYLTVIKSLVEDGSIAGTGNQIGVPGMLMRKIEKAGGNPNKTPIADNVGWAVFLLMAIDQVKHDPDIEPIIELLIRTHAGLSPHGYGGARTVDGHFVRNYDSNGLPKSDDPQPQVYVSMKFLPAAFKAAELYPDNKNLQQYKEYLRQLFKRSSDTIRAEQRITWTNDDHGPVLNNNTMSNETWIFGDIGAAQDPLATRNYATYAYDRDHFEEDNWLAGEPVIKASHSAFIVMGATLILNHHYSGSGWKEQNQNYYGATMAATDDMGAPYFGAFSAGNHPSCPDVNPDNLPCGNYYNDGPSDHPNDILHFPALLGFGQHQLTSPMVGGYMAYRDGRRQLMNNASGGDDIAMLTRWSVAHSDYVMNSVGIADFWYGGIGLAETLKPGTIDKLRADFYRPGLQVSHDNGRTVLTYSNITPRRVIGIDRDGTETSYGFQMSPFTLPAGVSHDHYKVVDPEGEWLELEDLVNELDGKEKRFTNPGFEQELTGWTHRGCVTTVSGIAGDSAQISGTGRISQPLNLSTDLTGSRYIVRGNAKALNNVSGKGYMRLTWRADKLEDSPPLGYVVTSTPVDATLTETEFEVETLKPEGADYLHIEYVVENSDDSFLFDNTSVVRTGARQDIPNGDFSLGSEGWEINNGAKIVDNPYAPGKAIEFSRSNSQTGWQKVSRQFNVGNDSLGTRYIFRFDAHAPEAGDFKFEAWVEVFDRNGDSLVKRYDVADVVPGQQGESVFTVRRRPDEAWYQLNFRMKRNEEASPETAYVYMSNFRVDKERLFDEADCVADSPTGCLPTRR